MAKPTTTPAEPSVPKRRRADAERSVAAILDAALEALASDPDSSMSEIARRAGVVRATIYVHYEQRENDQTEKREQKDREHATDSLAGHFNRDRWRRQPRRSPLTGEVYDRRHLKRFRRQRRQKPGPRLLISRASLLSWVRARRRDCRA